MVFPSSGRVIKASCFSAVDAGEGLEPVGVVGGPLLHRPVLHGVGHNVGGGHADVAPVLHHVHDLPEHPLGQALPHDGGAEDVGTEDLCHVHAHTFKPFPLPYRLPETKRGDKPAPSGHACPLRRPRALSAAVHWVHCIKNTVPAGILQVLKPTNFKKPPGTGCGIFHEKRHSGANIRLTGGFRPLYCFYQPKPAERGYNYVLHQGRHPPDRGGGRD